MKKGFFVLIGLVILGLVSCSKISKSDLEVEQAKWDALTATKYAYDYNTSCFCGGIDALPARIVIENNVITEVLDIQTGQAKTYGNSTPIIDSLSGTIIKKVDELFDIIEDARKDADDLEVTFDETNGFPTLISIDWIEDAVDDEISYTISNFETL